MKPSPSSQRQRRAGALLALLVLVAYLCDVFHQANEVHTICPVDGEIAHVEAGHGHAHGAHDHGSAEKGVSVDVGEPSDEGHGHCSLLLLSKKRAKVDAYAPDVRPAPKARPALAVHATAPIASRFARYLLAPKNSPPVGAAA